MSPILAAIVLDHLLRKINKKLVNAARKRDKASSDDGEGGLPIIMAYVDDANFVIPLEDEIGRAHV